MTCAAVVRRSWTPGHPPVMDQVIAPRLSPDHRTVLLPDTRDVPEVVGLAEATGWHLASASRTSDGVEVVLRR